MMTDSGDEVDIMDRIAQDLPPETRAAYYREMNYCRSLPEDDEMLRILRAMQFLTLLMREVPALVVVEREKLERLLSDAMAQLSETGQRAQTYQVALEKRLGALPASVAEGLSPERIAHEINENLRQQFVNSTLPQTAQAMGAIAAQLRTAVGEFGKTAAMLNDSHRGAAERARGAIERLECTVSDAARAAQRAANELSTVFQREFRWSLYALSSLALVIGLALGMLYQSWIDQPDTAAQAQPALDNAPTTKPKSH